MVAICVLVCRGIFNKLVIFMVILATTDSLGMRISYSETFITNTCT